MIPAGGPPAMGTSTHQLPGALGEPDGKVAVPETRIPRGVKEGWARIVVPERCFLIT